MYAMFMGQGYYPEGGWADLAGMYPTVSQAVAGRDERTAEDGYDDWAELVDLDTGAVVARWTYLRWANLVSERVWEVRP